MSLTNSTETKSVDFVDQDKKKLRRWKRSLILRHNRNHLEDLFRGTIPIFVAATINRAVSQGLEAAIGNGKGFYLHILIQVSYALLVAHVFGYLVAFSVPFHHPMYDYYSVLTSDNASFAWSATMTLIILPWIYSKYSVWVVIMAWAFLVLVVCTVIYCANVVQEFYLHPAFEIRSRLRDFESETFALAIGYSFTVIIAASIYNDSAADYLSNTDDINTDALDENKGDSLYWMFFVYVALGTMFLIGYQWSIDRNIKKMRANYVVRSLKRENRLSSFSTSNKVDSVPYSMIPTINEDDANEEVSINFREGEEEEVSALLTKGDSTLSRSCEKWLFYWDKDKNCKAAYLKLYYNIISYTISCGWHIWSTFSFVTFFHFKGGKLLALFVFAVVVTLCTTALMTVVSIRKELSGLSVNSFDAMGSSLVGTLEAEGILYLSFGRLTVGWAWQTLFSEVVDEIIPKSIGHERIGMLLGFKVLTALLVFLLGYQIELYLNRRKQTTMVGIERVYTESQLVKEHGVVDNAVTESLL